MTTADLVIVIGTDGFLDHSIDLVPLKSLWEESPSSSDASSTTLRPPPIRRGALPKEGSFPRLKDKRLQSERSAGLGVPERARADLTSLARVGGCGGSGTGFTGKHAASLANSFDSGGK